MKKSVLIAALVTLPLSMPFASADDTHHPDKDKKPATAMDGGSAGNAGSSSRPTTMTDKDKQMQMTKMQANMLKMHEQMHKIMDAKNPQEREQLMQAHAKMMEEDMQIMKNMKGGHEMMGNDGMGGKMDGTSMMDGGSNMNAGAMDGRMNTK